MKIQRLLATTRQSPSSRPWLASSLDYRSRVRKVLRLCVGIICACTTGTNDASPDRRDTPERSRSLAIALLAAVDWEVVCGPSRCSAVAADRSIYLAKEPGFQSPPRVRLGSFTVVDLPREDSLPSFILSDADPQRASGSSTVAVAVYPPPGRGDRLWRATAYAVSDQNPMGLTIYLHAEPIGGVWRIERLLYQPY